MFIEDIHLGVMPWRAQSSDRAEYKVDILGNDHDQKRTVALLSSLAKHEHRNIEENLSDAIREVVQQLAWHGQSVHEILQNQDHESCYRLQDFTPRRLLHVFGYFIQLVPKEDRDLWKKTITVLPENDIWAIYMPKALGGYIGYRATIRGLNMFQHLGPNFRLTDLEKFDRTPYFDFQRYVREAQIFNFRITKNWGWNHRDSSLNNCTEFMLFYKILTFKWAQAIVREHIISEFNALLIQLGIDSKVIVAGLPSPTDILRIRGEMSDGTISFSGASEATSL